MQISKDDFEFQMLYGVRTDLQRRLGPGTAIASASTSPSARMVPYFMRRLAERPANVGFLVRNFFRG